VTPDWYLRLYRALHSVSGVDPLPGLQRLQAELEAVITEHAEARLVPHPGDPEARLVLERIGQAGAALPVLDPREPDEIIGDGYRRRGGL
jgi:hypothetical protein